MMYIKSADFCGQAGEEKSKVAKLGVICNTSSPYSSLLNEVSGILEVTRHVLNQPGLSSIIKNIPPEYANLDREGDRAQPLITDKKPCHLN